MAKKKAPVKQKPRTSYKVKADMLEAENKELRDHIVRTGNSADYKYEALERESRTAKRDLHDANLRLKSNDDTMDNLRWQIRWLQETLRMAILDADKLKAIGADVSKFDEECPRPRLSRF
jgi:seryl-tRNA synthetase